MLFSLLKDANTAVVREQHVVDMLALPRVVVVVVVSSPYFSGKEKMSAQKRKEERKKKKREKRERCVCGFRVLCVCVSISKSPV